MKIILFILFIIVTLTQNYPKQSPVIGIYTQTNDQQNLDHFQSYISAGYVKFIQMSGAQVVPIFAFSNQEDIDQLLPKINGVLFPGGNQTISLDQKWTQNAKYILQWAQKQNDAGNTFPIWSVCLGFQTLAFITSGNPNNMSTLSPVRGQMHTLNIMKFVNISDKGYLCQNFPQDLIQKLTTGQGVMFYDHYLCVSLDTYNNNKNLSTYWKLVTQSTSLYNETFVAHWQARRYPFYGFQFHPQKAGFQWKVYTDKSYEAIQIPQIIGNKFIEKARQSKNSFSSYDEFQKYSIDNYQATATTFPLTRIYRFLQKDPNISNQGVITY